MTEQRPVPAVARPSVRATARRTMLGLFLGVTPLLSGCLVAGSADRTDDTTPRTGFAVTGSDDHVWLTVAPDRVTLLDPVRQSITTQSGGEVVVTASGGGWQTPTGLVQIRADGDSVKLRDGAGNTQWKAKLGNKIKILQGKNRHAAKLTPPSLGG